MELAWIGDFNPVMNRMIETYVCATRARCHTTYRYLFDRTKEFPPLSRLGGSAVRNDLLCCKSLFPTGNFGGILIHEACIEHGYI